MVDDIAGELEDVADQAAIKLRRIEDAVAAAKRSPEAWSIQEILGHLIDSAANNHQRFVRAQQAGELAFPGYDQDSWVRVQGHQSRPWSALIELWAHYNHHLAHTIRQIPSDALDVPCRIGTNDAVTLGFLLEDYLVHLRHHLRQIDERHTKTG